jgi:aspartyl aminopeptidase
LDAAAVSRDVNVAHAYEPAYVCYHFDQRNDEPGKPLPLHIHIYTRRSYATAAILEELFSTRKKQSCVAIQHFLSSQVTKVGLTFAFPFFRVQAARAWHDSSHPA